MPTDSEDETAGFSAAARESEIFSGLEGRVGKRECTYMNFAIRAAQTRISSFSEDMSRFEMLETALVAAAELAIAGTVP